jgi:hypothetical protein
MKIITFLLSTDRFHVYKAFQRLRDERTPGLQCFSNQERATPSDALVANAPSSYIAEIDSICQARLADNGYLLRNATDTAPIVRDVVDLTSQINTGLGFTIQNAQTCSS